MDKSFSFSGLSTTRDVLHGSIGRCIASSLSRVDAVVHVYVLSIQNMGAGETAV
jgi:hypothetical protein